MSCRQDLIKSIISIILVLPLLSNAQSVEIGELKKIDSKILNQHREYYISLPNSYNDERFSNQKYPVIYQLDGEKHFEATAGIINSLSADYYPFMPEAILVSIKNVDRSKDLTQTIDSTQKFNSGGADDFLKFLTKELKKEIDRKYRTLGFNILIGHSFGGLFVINALCKSHKSFNAYISIDPSIWWDNQQIIEVAESLKEVNNYAGNTLLFFEANSIKNLKKPSGQALNHFNSKKKFITSLKNGLFPNLNYKIETYENEDHGSIVLPAIINGFRLLFKGFRLNVHELLKTPTLLETNYQTLSTKLGFTFVPQSQFLIKLAMLANEKGLVKVSEKLYKLNDKFYSKNSQNLITDY